jgi:hypothetical protein
MAVEILCSDDSPVACVVCDWCGERIESGDEGEAWWHKVPGRRWARPRFAHKGACGQSSRRTADDAGLVADQSLDGFLSSLRRSTPTPVLAARRRRSTDARKRR